MDLTLSPSEEAFRDEVRAWLADNHPGEPPEDEKEAFEFSRRWQRKLHEANWAGLSWPKEYGGRGATLIEQAIFFEEMTRVKAPRVANVLGSPSARHYAAARHASRSLTFAPMRRTAPA